MVVPKRSSITFRQIVIICTILSLLLFIATCIFGCTCKTIELPTPTGQVAIYKVCRCFLDEELGKLTYDPETGLFEVEQFDSSTAAVNLSYLNMGIQMGSKKSTE